MILETREYMYMYVYVCKAGLIRVVQSAQIEYYMYTRGFGKEHP